MGDFIFNTILWTLALYGAFEIIKTIINIYTYTNLKSDGIYIIIAVKNQANKIEGFLRSFLFRVIYGKQESIKDIIIADLDSKDETKIILEKLNKEYDEIKVINRKECKEIIENIKNVWLIFWLQIGIIYWQIFKVMLSLKSKKKQRRNKKWKKKIVFLRNKKV